MPLEPWFKVATARKEVREGRSFNPDEFAIHLEQVVAKTAPDDYREPGPFFSRTCWTRALREHTGMVLRRLVGRTDNTAPVLTLVTQFGGGKTHTLTALYHLAKNGPKSAAFNGVPELTQQAGIPEVPKGAVAVFVGSAWDPLAGRECPWLDLAHQLAGQKGIEALGPAAKTSPPGTEALARVFEAAGGCVLILFDEVLNFLNRHRPMAEPFHAFIQNLTVATTATTRGAAVISLPRSQVEMTDWDFQWQERITKVVRRVAKDLIANDEAEIGEVLRRRLFEDLGPEKTRRAVAKAFADWCFERRAQLPPEWTAVDTAATEKKAREFLQKRFEDCYPFHPATISVFQRKWQTLAQFQQTRGTLAMLAQWISKAAEKGFREARREPLITLGSAPLEVPEFRSVVLGQLGETRLGPAIDTDISGAQSHARALDADTQGPLKDSRRRVGAAILFESSGGQVDKVAHLPELRFALGEPELDTTSIDTAAYALEAKAYYIRRVGSDGFRIFHQPTLKKVVSDRRASLDPDSEVRPTMRDMVRKEFEKGASIPIERFPADGSAVPDSPRLTLVLMDPDTEWSGAGAVREQVAEWTKKRGQSDRLYPGSLVWCFRKPGRDFRDKVENWLAWKRVADELTRGVLGSDFDRTEHSEVQGQVADAEEDARDEVWAAYRFAVIADNREPDGLKAIDIGAGHASASETLCGRVIAALKSDGLLNESVGAGYIERNWPPALRDSGAWPLTGLRQSFLNGALTRLLDPDRTLKQRIVEFVQKAEFGLVSGQTPEGTYQRLWFNELVGPEEVTFDAGVFLLTRARAQALKSHSGTTASIPRSGPSLFSPPASAEQSAAGGGAAEATSAPSPEVPETALRTLRLVGEIPSEQWNRLGTKLLPKLRAAGELEIQIEFSVTIKPEAGSSLEVDLRQALEDLGLHNRIRIEHR
jgi:Protein of unknown function (DUF499)